PRLAEGYKIPAAFAGAARLTEGRALLDEFLAGYCGSEWHFVDPNDTVPKSRMCDLYEDLWLAWGALALGRGDIAAGIMSFVQRFVDPGTGGVRSGTGLTSTPKTIVDLRSTALAGIVWTMSGRLDMAATAARFCENVYADQPNTSLGFALVRSTED